MSHETDTDIDTIAPLAITTSNQPEPCDINHFVDSMRKLIDSAVFLARTEDPNGVNAENAVLALGVLKSSADSIFVMAETFRGEAATRNAIAEAQIKRSFQLPEYTEEANSSKDVDAQTPNPRELDASKYAYSGLVGSITWESLDCMSEERLKALDETLKRIVRSIGIYGINWDTIGSKIHTELVAFGFPFASAKDLDSKSDWARVADTGSSDLSRIVAMLNCYRDARKEWYPNEMLHVVRRLMELRGFQA